MSESLFHLLELKSRILIITKPTFSSKQEEYLQFQKDIKMGEKNQHAAFMVDFSQFFALTISL